MPGKDEMVDFKSVNDNIYIEKHTSDARRLPSAGLSLSLCRASIGERMMVPARRIPAPAALMLLPVGVVPKATKIKSPFKRILISGSQRRFHELPSVSSSGAFLTKLMYAENKLLSWILCNSLAAEKYA